LIEDYSLICNVFVRQILVTLATYKYELSRCMMVSNKAIQYNSKFTLSLLSN